MIIYVVQAGDTLESIAREYGISLSRLVSLNELNMTDKLAVGQTLVILYPEEVYTVKSGDTLYSISEEYGVSVDQILRNNPILKGKTDLYAGQSIVIKYSGEKEGRIGVNGYIYPFIDKDILIRTLPYLTYLTIFTYGFTPAGDLVDQGINEYGIPESELIELSKQYNVAPVMHLSTLTENGNFDNTLAEQILNNPSSQDRLIENIITRMDNMGYYGFDVDFEYLDSKNRDTYTTFVSRLKQALSENGYILITALIPKTSENQTGDLYESHDYGGLGSVSDYVLLMTYEWGYAFGPPMAVAPSNEVERVVRYAITEIDPSKIFLGVPNYAYDWPLPFVMGETRAKKITNTEAVNLAIEKGVVIQYDEIAQSPYFMYRDGQTEHIVWFDDARSIDAKLSLISKYDLYGASYWNIMDWFPQNWLVINSKFDIEKVI